MLIPLIRKDKRLSRISKLFMVFLIDVLKEDSSSDMSYRDLDREMDISPGSQSDTIIPELEQAGYIRSGKLPGQSGPIYINDVPTMSRWRQVDDSTIEYSLNGTTFTVTVSEKNQTE